MIKSTFVLFSVNSSVEVILKTINVCTGSQLNPVNNVRRSITAVLFTMEATNNTLKIDFRTLSF